MKKIALVFFLSVSFFSFAKSNLGGSSLQYDVTHLFRESSPRFFALGEKILSLETIWSGQSHPSRVIFEDLMPGANWNHPARYIFQNENGRTIQEVDTTSPPKDLESIPVLNVDNKRPIRANQNVEFKINDFEGKFKVKEPARFFALLINGQADQRHWNDFSFLYRVLTKVYGYSKENIFVADSVAFSKQKRDLDGDGVDDIQHPSTIKGIEELFTQLKGKTRSQDHLLVAVNDHGDRRNGESTIVLSDGQMPTSQFSKLMDTLAVKEFLGIFEQCFSGGFVRPLAKGKKVAMSAATDEEFSWASMDLKFDEFIYYVISAFAMQTYEGKPIEVQPDTKQGVSALAAFSYATKMDQRPESPLLETGRNSGGSRTIGLGF